MSENLTDQEKLKKSEEALIAFFGQFGEPDIYVQVFLEVLFEEIFKSMGKTVE